MHTWTNLHLVFIVAVGFQSTDNGNRLIFTARFNQIWLQQLKKPRCKSFKACSVSNLVDCLSHFSYSLFQFCVFGFWFFFQNKKVGLSKPCDLVQELKNVYHECQIFSNFSLILLSCPTRILGLTPSTLHRLWSWRGFLRWNSQKQKQVVFVILEISPDKMLSYLDPVIFPIT